jgi:hypothetical protein
MWHNKTVSVILPTFNEKDSIRQCILNFSELGIVDEIIVVNNNAVAGTHEAVTDTRAKEILEARQGYGAAIQRGFHEASGDFIVVCEPDGTFSERDILKLLVYADECDIVFGSRTVREFIWRGANMGLLLRWGNYLVAKLIEVLFNTNSLSDVGCTLRLASRAALEKMSPHFRVSGNHFGPEMMLLAARCGMRFIQVPINYRPRVGTSSVTGHMTTAILLGLRMVAMILRHRAAGRLTATSQPPTASPGTLRPLALPYVLGGLGLLAIFWLWHPLFEPLHGDASLFVVLVQKALGFNRSPLIDLSSGRDIWHPFLYQGLLIITATIFGPNLLTLRLFGLFCLVIDLVLIGKIGCLVTPSQQERRLVTAVACTVFVLQPYALKGALHPDIDTTVLTPLILAFVLSCERLLSGDRAWHVRDLIPATLLFALTLWAKLTTALLLPLALGVVLLLQRRRRLAALLPSLVFLLGGAVFLVTWWAFCLLLGFPFTSVFTRIFLVSQSKTMEAVFASPALLLRDLALFVFWFNPVILLCWVAAAYHFLASAARGRPPRGIILLSCVVATCIDLTYLYIGRIAYGVPKYHYPHAALAAVCIAYWAYPWLLRLPTRRVRLCLAAGLLLAVVYFFLGDPIRIANVELKLAALSNSSLAAPLTRLSLLSLGYAAPLLIALVLTLESRRELAGLLMLSALLGQTIGFNSSQSLAGYQTTYAYGYRGARAVEALLPSNSTLLIPDGAFVPARGIVGREELVPPGHSLAGWIRTITEERPGAILAGPSLVPLQDMRGIFANTAMRSLLETQYQACTIGDYVLYVKK